MEAIGMFKIREYFQVIIILMGLMVSMLFLGGCSEKEDDLFIPPSPDVVVNQPEVQKDENIVVEIKGHVVNPGVYSLKTNQRLNDLVQISGGVTENANLRHVNLAMKIMDGDSFYIPSMDEEVDQMAQNSSGGSGGENKDGKIDLNTATKEQLMTVTGIGPATADNILAYREENGAFKTVEDLLQVNRIGEKTLDKIRDAFIVR